MNTNSSPAPEPPAPLGRAVVVIALALLAGFGVTRWLDLRGRETYTGYLQARTTVLAAPTDASLREIAAAEGTLVEPGEPVLVLTDDKIAADRAKQRQIVVELQAQLEQARARGAVDLAWRMKALDTELHAARLDSARFLQAQFDRRVQLQAWQDYLAGGMIASRVTHDEFIGTLLRDSRMSNEGRLRALLEEESARNGLEVATAQLQLCDARVRELERLKHELPQSVARAAGVDRLEAQLSRAANELKGLQAQPAEIALTAPAYGKVGVYRKEVGDRVTAGETIVEILDEERRCLVAQIPSRRLAGFTAGAKVDLRFPGGDRRTGVIRRIPPQTTAATDADALITLHIDPAGKLWPDVPIGSAVEVTTRR